jgi:diguanylate cyclase (GGDEF)-like protein
VLSDFARTVITDFPIQRILDHLVRRIVEIMPVSAAGVTLIVEGAAPRYIAASDDSALRFEQLQSTVGEGPCLLAFHLGQPVALPDISREDRFPAFGPAAQDEGLAAVFAFPLRHGSGRLGSLNLYRDTTGSLAPEDMEAAQTLADVAAAYLLNAESRDAALRTTEQLRHLALHDALTGLPNRALLEEHLNAAAERSRHSPATATVLFIDLDQFKHINDVYGHHVGDELLIAVADRLKAFLRPGDTLARVSGDEFVFLCEGVTSPRDAARLATRVTNAFRGGFELRDRRLSISASVGVAYSGAGGSISEQLLIDADMAMYAAKRGGGDGYRLINQHEANRRHQRHGLERDLREAVEGDALAVNYQPIVRTSDGLVTGVEALMRWTHRVRGPVAPRTAIGIAERSELINDIGQWVLQRSVADRVHWLANAPDSSLDLAVNVSARQLLSHGFYDQVATVLSTSGMDPEALILEVTENILIEDGHRAITVLRDLKKLGVRLALDDFGTGFSSLSYLRRLPIDVVKIDRAFVADLDNGPQAEAIIAAVTRMAHQLGLTVIAEGVETRTERDHIARMGCDHAQGFYYARAMPAAALGRHIGDMATRLRHPPDEGPRHDRMPDARADAT